MSGLAGVVAADGAAAARLAPARAALAGRLSPAAPVCRGDRAALTGSAIEARGPFIAAADARLDNRPDLAAALALREDAGDAALILAAYEKWGQACPAHLRGDFAFAIWDGARGALFCARDHFGVRPFVYAHARGAFAFGSTTKAVRMCVGAGEIDDARIGDFLAGFIADHESTLYRGVRRLPPGSALRFANGEIRISSYWRPPERSEPASKDAAEDFRALFESAVRTRLTADSGVMLSGGLDSSSIALIAARARRVDSFTMGFASGADERAFSDAALRAGVFTPHHILADARGPFADLDRMLDEQDGLFLAPGLAGTRQIYAAARGAGLAALLDGHGGDEAVSHGRGQLKVAARAGAWGELWRCARAEAGLYGGSRADVFLAYWLRFGPLQRPLRAVRRLTRADKTPPAWRRYVNADFAKAIDLGARYRAAQLRDFDSEAQNHRDLVAAPLQAHALETLNNASAAAGIEPRYPFWDKPLVEFCLRLPPHEKIGEHGTRLILRRALGGVLPPEIAARRDKFDFTAALAAAMCAHHRAQFDDIFLAEASALAPYADRAALKAAYLRVRTDPLTAPGEAVQAVWRGAALASWLAWRKRAAPALQFEDALP